MTVISVLLGPGRILVLLIACFITFDVHRALQQKQQHQCIIYVVRCRSLLGENSGQISIGDSNTECMQIEFEFFNQSLNILNLFNIPTNY